jgi:hypothetical protein
MQLKIPTRHIDIILITIMAFVCGVVLILTRHITANNTANQWLLKKQATSISCVTARPNEPGSSGDKNNGGGCAHQLGASCLLTITADKRQKSHTC